MNSNEAWGAATWLLEVIQRFDDRTVGETDVGTWAAAIVAGDWDLEVAREAVVEHALERPDVRLRPGHVHAFVKARRDDVRRIEAQRERERRRAQDPGPRPVAALLASWRGFPAPPEAAPESLWPDERLSVPCPWCRAPAWSGCVKRTSKGVVAATAPHPSRRDALAAAVGA